MDKHTDATSDQGDDLFVAGTDASVPTVIDADEYEEARSAVLARHELSMFVGPDTDERVEALMEAIMELPEFKAVGGGAVGATKLVCAVCDTPTIVCECGDDRCPKCDPGGCPGA